MAPRARREEQVKITCKRALEASHGAGGRLVELTLAIATGGRSTPEVALEAHWSDVLLCCVPGTEPLFSLQVSPPAHNSKLGVKLEETRAVARVVS